MLPGEYRVKAPGALVRAGIDGTNLVEDPLNWTILVLVLVGVPCALITAPWLKVVFKRYPVTIALPIEYGVLNIFSVACGFFFFKEGEYMAGSWQLARPGKLWLPDGSVCLPG